MGGKVNYSGLVIAGIGFFLTRFTVTLAIYEDPVRFYVAGVVPLALGLGLAAFGVALAVADIEASMVRTTATWCAAGAGAMLVLVVLTLLGSTADGLPDLATVRSQTYLSNFLIGGSVGGTLTGLYAIRNRRHRTEVQQQANRLLVLNRMLRHEVLNSVTVIQGYGTTETADEARAREIIGDQSRAIQRTIDEVKHLVGSAKPGGRSLSPIDVRSALEASVETVCANHPAADVTIEHGPEDLTVRATQRVEQVFAHLLENAIVHGNDEAPVVEVTATADAVRISVIDDGPGLPERQRALLETGDVQTFDDPGTGFGLNVVRLFVDDFGGSVETDVGPAGTTITVLLPRTSIDGASIRPLPSGVTGVRPAIPHLIVTLVAALIAGVVYGVVSELLGGSIAGIGVFYGTVSTVVGWLTHEFHSVVFGFVFAGLVSVAPERYRTDVLAHVVIGVGWSVFLWLVAAGLVAPVWLRLLGIPASIPNLSLPLLANHLAWGASLGLLTAWGYAHATPGLDRLVDRARFGHGRARSPQRAD